ncbi:hypothetical protein FGSG_11136 [Fusarium graminearum PH-1]|uniref:Chromosome 3, complete genome n=1 Tax=Gibberella zeae (strain ATCC MYA-4620 / CBS 123657 / FGSC 9075 / NRRL 31084 / PH-1) TaxID=229533 RepID=I1S2X8_GIBZE|nr:hypothetical protein FGSG_11136 [Fusarium graminearum PH-1]ESU17593.1 hypothetical protein FGSG_11136 [Fusarium graminearum PH-1]CEF86876.1 unnamed protein product [Fusarium graminearum]|eukprot:XP_011325215.1 hypothetical protein FGSG_11136 [Fusarium graminearum PH-1]
MVASKLILAAIAFGPVAAGPCRPSPTKVLSSTTDFSSSSMISLSDSSLSSRTTHDASTSKELGPETTTNIAADTSLISITVTFESTTTIPTDSQGTVADATSDIKTETTAEGTSTMETTPTNDIASTTLESTTEGSGSASTATVTTGTATTEPTTTIAESTVESESSSVQATSTTEATTGTTEAITTTTEVTTTTAETTITEAITTTTEVTTTTAETTTTEATTTTTSIEPVSTTFNLLVQGGAMANGVALYSNGQDALVLNSQAAAAWFTSYSTAPLSYDPITRHLLLGDKRLCLMYDSITIASFAICQGPPVGQKFELTCDDPSDGSLRCNIPAKQYISKDNIFVDTGDTWSHFYLLEVNRQFSPGVFRIIIAKDNLSNNDIKYAAFERITIKIVTRSLSLIMKSVSSYGKRCSYRHESYFL